VEISFVGEMETAFAERHQVNFYKATEDIDGLKVFVLLEISHVYLIFILISLGGLRINKSRKLIPIKQFLEL
jgi:hypothetical protein